MLPQEEMLEVGKKKSKLFIGIPKEISFQEDRVALGPASVALLVNNGHDIIVQRGAGKESNFSDNAYSEAGAAIGNDAAEVYNADVLLKVAPPSVDEIILMKNRQTLFSAMQITTQPKDYIKNLMSKKITSIAWDYIQDEEGILPIVRTMGEIAGNTAVLIASELLSKASKGQGLMLGGISGVSPTSVVILGAGTVGEFAARAALGLGASVKVFDNSIFKLNRLQNGLGMRIFTSTLQPRDLIKALKRADVVIGAIRAPHGRTPCVVTEEMVSEMKAGSVIVDVSIDQGGCFETSQVTSHQKPTFEEYGIIHYCVPNIASRVSRTASFALSNIFAPILLNMGEGGGVENMLRRNAGVRKGVYIYKGTLTDQYLGESLKIPYKDIELLMAAF